MHYTQSQKDWKSLLLAHLLTYCLSELILVLTYPHCQCTLPSFLKLRCCLRLSLQFYINSLWNACLIDCVHALGVGECMYDVYHLHVCIRVHPRREVLVVTVYSFSALFSLLFPTRLVDTELQSPSASPPPPHTPNTGVRDADSGSFIGVPGICVHVSLLHR